MAKPDFDRMWISFPDHELYPTLTSLFTHIGGALQKNIHVPGFGPSGNTCAVRMSRALNSVNGKIAQSLGLNTLTGADKMLYLFRVSKMRKYLLHAFGVTHITVTQNFSNPFSDQRGIVAFEVGNWGDASGHLALWSGTSFREPTHDDFRHLKDDPATAFREPQTRSMTLWPL